MGLGRALLRSLNLPQAFLLALGVFLFGFTAGAVVLDFESQSPGAPSGPIIEGDFTITAPSVEPFGPTCPTPGAGTCPSVSDGQYVIAAVGEVITLARTDGEPFDLESISYDTFLPLGGVVSVQGVNSLGGSVGDSFPIVVSGFMGFGVFSSNFDDVVSVEFSLSGGLFNLALDNITIADPPPDPVVGTPGTMVLLVDDRRVDASGRICFALPQGGEDCGPVENNTATPSTPFVLFPEGVTGGAGFASQVSTANTAELEGSGVAYGSADLSGETSTNGAGNSFYDVQFQLLAPARIQIAGSLSNFDTSGGGIGGGTTDFALTRGSTVIYSASVETDNPDAVLFFDEVVSPGTYRVVAHADGYIWVQSAFDFILAARPANLVPALSPVTIGALFAGLISMGAVGLRKL